MQALRHAGNEIAKDAQQQDRGLHGPLRRRARVTSDEWTVTVDGRQSGRTAVVTARHLAIARGRNWPRSIRSQ